MERKQKEKKKLHTAHSFQVWRRKSLHWNHAYKSKEKVQKHRHKDKRGAFLLLLIALCGDRWETKCIL